MLKTVVLLHIFVKTDAFYSEFFDKYKVQKNSIYLKLFYNIVHFFTDTLNQLNASLLTLISLKKKNKSLINTPPACPFWMVCVWISSADHETHCESLLHLQACRSFRLF